MQKNKRVSELDFGDIIKLDFSPTEGHEQHGYRPAVVLTDPKSQNSMLNGMTSVAPITKIKKGFPTHVLLDSQTEIRGSILVEHHRMLDLRSRNFVYVEKLPLNKLQEVKRVFEALYQDLLSL